MAIIMLLCIPFALLFLLLKAREDTRKVWDGWVQTLFEKAGFVDGQDAYFDATRFAALFGFKVDEIADFKYNMYGHISVQLKTESNRAIAVNHYLDIESKRHIIFYEICYWLLHSDCQSDFSHKMYEGDGMDMNDVASYLAISLMMPKKSFTKLYRDLTAQHYMDGEKVRVLMEIFKAPEHCVWCRMQNVKKR